MLKPKECPCQGCTDRTITCHDTCTNYKTWLVEYKEKNDSLRKDADNCYRLNHRDVLRNRDSWRWSKR